MLEGFETVSRDEGDGRAARQWLLKRNCALSPHQLMRFYLTLVVVTTAIGIGFALCGAWVVLPFSGLDVVALGIALLVYARHAGDHDRVVLGGQGLTIEQFESGRARAVRMNPAWVRVAIDAGGHGAVMLSESGRHVRVGRHAPIMQRRQFAQELMQALGRASGAAHETV
jgi:uncharacterized membrane protein